MANQPLSDLTVVELTQGISGPYCTKMLADMGAEVIKVEEPGSGNFLRGQGPFPDDVPDPERSGEFLYLNTNKLGITLNIKTRRGRKILGELLSQADVFVESYPRQMMEELGLHYEAVKKLNPKLVMTSITPFGHTGPYRDFKAYDVSITAAGAMSYSTGSPDREPLSMPASQGSYYPGANAAAATMLALYVRDVKGIGQDVDLSQIACFGMSFAIAGGVAIRGEVYAQRFGHRLGGVYPYTVLPCKDGYFRLCTIEESMWQRVLEMMGNPEWGKDSRFADTSSRFQHADELDALMGPWLMSHTKAELYKLCRDKRVPGTPVQTMEEVVNNEHLNAREFFVKIEHPEAGKLTYPGAPCKYSTLRWEVRRPAPRLGQHNEEVYCGRLGYTEQDLADQRRAGVI